MNAITLRFWSTKLTVIAAILVLANAAAAAVGPALSPPLEFANPIAQAKHDQLHETGRPPCVDLVVAGASVASYGVDPELLSTLLPGSPSGYNAALFGSLLGVETDWLERFVLPVTKPSLILYVLPTAVFHTDSAGLAFNLDQWQSARATRQGRLASADRWAADHLPLYRYRAELTDAGQLLRWVTGRPPRDSLDLGDASLRPSGFTTKGGTWDPSSPRAGQALVTLGRRYAGWQVEDSELAALRGFVERRRAEQLPVVFVLPPMTAANLAAHPGGGADLSRYRLAVGGLAADLTVPVLDLSELSIPDADYADPVHLGPRGAATFTEAVATELSRQGASPLPCAP